MTPGKKVTSAHKTSLTLSRIPMPPEGTASGAELTASSTPHSPWVQARKRPVAPGSHSKGKKEKLNLKRVGLSQCKRLRLWRALNRTWTPALVLEHRRDDTTDTHRGLGSEKPSLLTDLFTRQ